MLKIAERDLEDSKSINEIHAKYVYRDEDASGSGRSDCLLEVNCPATTPPVEHGHDDEQRSLDCDAESFAHPGHEDGEDSGAAIEIADQSTTLADGGTELPIER